MRIINHALTGALIGLTISRPVLAVPLAVISHFICDAIPHYNADLGGRSIAAWISSTKFQWLLLADAALCLVLVLLLAAAHPLHWQLSAACAFLAAAPDLLWLTRYLSATSNKTWQPSAYSKFAEGIQWFQRPIGAVVEFVWFAGACVLLAPWLH